MNIYLFDIESFKILFQLMYKLDQHFQFTHPNFLNLILWQRTNRDEIIFYLPRILDKCLLDKTFLLELVRNVVVVIALLCWWALLLLISVKLMPLLLRPRLNHDWLLKYFNMLLTLSIILLQLLHLMMQLRILLLQQVVVLLYRQSVSLWSCQFPNQLCILSSQLWYLSF